jgi:hypothetical protein
LTAPVAACPRQRQHNEEGAMTALPQNPAFFHGLVHTMTMEYPDLRAIFSVVKAVAIEMMTQDRVAFFFHPLFMGLKPSIYNIVKTISIFLIHYAVYLEETLKKYQAGSTYQPFSLY